MPRAIAQAKNDFEGKTQGGLLQNVSPAPSGRLLKRRHAALGLHPFKNLLDKDFNTGYL